MGRLAADCTPEQLERVRAQRRASYARHREKTRYRVKERYKGDPSERQKLLQRNRERYWANAELYRARQREQSARNAPAIREKAKDRRRREPAETLLRQTKHRARNKGLPFNLTLPFVTTLLKQTHCAVTGLPFTNYDRSHARHPFNRSIDRIVPSEGYTEGNVRLCCLMFNLMKSSWQDGDCIELARALIQEQAGSLPHRLPDRRCTGPLSQGELVPAGLRPSDSAQLWLPGLAPDPAVAGR